MQYKCEICQSDFEAEKPFHSHLKSHKMLLCDYYEKFYPKKDLFTGEKIPFYVRQEYFDKDFLTKSNMQSWLKKESKETARKYCKDLLLRRKEKKNLIYTPTQVELRTILSPSIIFYQEIFDDYYNLCADLGFKNKHHKFNQTEQYLIKRNIRQDKPNIIKIDTRENKLLHFNTPTKVEKLDFGDYAAEYPQMSNFTVIERKSLTDFIGTLSKGLIRFSNEIERAGHNNYKIVVLVEKTLNYCLNFDNIEYIKKFHRTNAAHIFHGVRELLQTYPYLQFLFVTDRSECSRIVTKLLSEGPCFEDLDLQLLYDTQNL